MLPLIMTVSNYLGDCVDVAQVRSFKQSRRSPRNRGTIGSLFPQRCSHMAPASRRFPGTSRSTLRGPRLGLVRGEALGGTQVRGHRANAKGAMIRPLPFVGQANTRPTVTPNNLFGDSESDHGGLGFRIQSCACRSSGRDDFQSTQTG